MKGEESRRKGKEGMEKATQNLKKIIVSEMFKNN